MSENSYRDDSFRYRSGEEVAAKLEVYLNLVENSRTSVIMAKENGRYAIFADEVELPYGPGFRTRDAAEKQLGILMSILRMRRISPQQ